MAVGINLIMYEALVRAIGLINCVCTLQWAVIVPAL